MKCTKCGNTDGYYKYTPVYGKISTHYNGDGSYDEDSGINGDMYDSISYREEQKTAYCRSCHKKLTKKELEGDE